MPNIFGVESGFLRPYVRSLFHWDRV